LLHKKKAYCYLLILVAHVKQMRVRMVSYVPTPIKECKEMTAGAKR